MNAAASESRVGSLEFLTAIFGDEIPGDLQVSVLTLPGVRYRRFRNLAAAADFATAQRDLNVYFAVGLIRGDPSGRGEAKDVGAIGGFWADIDIAHEVHKNGNLPPSRDAALDILKRMPLPPTAIVFTGYGLHAYWLFKELWVFGDEADRERAAGLARAWHGLVCQLAADDGWSLENLGDLARVLRVPGTRNLKIPDRPVEVAVLHWESDRRYDVSDFDAYVSPVSPPEAKPATAELLLDPAAGPPLSRFATAVSSSSRFRLTWLQKRTDLTDQSQSGYDLSLATQAARFGWADQEIADLLIAFRREHGDQPEKALRLDYIARTISKARESVSDRLDMSSTASNGQASPENDMATEPNSIPAPSDPPLAGMESSALTSANSTTSSTMQNSIPAKGGSLDAGMESGPPKFWIPIPLSELGEEGPIPWLWTGFLIPGFVTQLVGLYKAGKSTLVAWLLLGMAAGGDIAGKITPARVLLVSEEGRGLWRRRRDELGIGDHVELLCRPFKGRPTWKAWYAFLEHVARLTAERKFDLVIFDTISVMLPVKSENDAAEMLQALTPMHQITDANAALLLVHHPNKSDGSEGTASRGSGALPGFVDVITELRRYTPKDQTDRRRALTSYSRFDETPSEVVIELSDDGYRLVGTKLDARKSDRQHAIRMVVPAIAPGMTAEEVLTAWPENGVPRPSLRTIRSDLHEMDDLVMSGEGTKGDPQRFHRSSSPKAPITT